MAEESIIQPAARSQLIPREAEPGTVLPPVGLPSHPTGFPTNSLGGTSTSHTSSAASPTDTNLPGSSTPVGIGFLIVIIVTMLLVATCVGGCIWKFCFKGKEKKKKEAKYRGPMVIPHDQYCSSNGYQEYYAPTREQMHSQGGPQSSTQTRDQQQPQTTIPLHEMDNSTAHRIETISESDAESTMGRNYEHDLRVQREKNAKVSPRRGYFDSEPPVHDRGSGVPF